MARLGSGGFYHKQRRTFCGQKSSSWATGIKQLERRDLLSATQFKPDFLVLPHASTSVAGYTPAQLRAAYGFNNASFGSTTADGRGQTIAIIDAYNDPNIASDLNTFNAQFGIAAPPSLKIVNENGGASLPGTDPNQDWEGETALDVEWAHAIAPGANLLLVEANSASDSDLFAGVNYARQQSSVSVISMSWGSDDSLANATSDNSLSNAYLVRPAATKELRLWLPPGTTGIRVFRPSRPMCSPSAAPTCI